MPPPPLKQPLSPGLAAAYDRSDLEPEKEDGSSSQPSEFPQRHPLGLWSSLAHDNQPEIPQLHITAPPGLSPLQPEERPSPIRTMPASIAKSPKKRKTSGSEHAQEVEGSLDLGQSQRPRHLLKLRSRDQRAATDPTTQQSRDAQQLHDHILTPMEQASESKGDQQFAEPRDPRRVASLPNVHVPGVGDAQPDPLNTGPVYTGMIFGGSCQAPNSAQSPVIAPSTAQDQPSQPGHDDIGTAEHHSHTTPAQAQPQGHQQAPQQDQQDQQDQQQQQQQQQVGPTVPENGYYCIRLRFYELGKSSQYAKIFDDLYRSVTDATKGGLRMTERRSDFAFRAVKVWLFNRNPRPLLLSDVTHRRPRAAESQIIHLDIIAMHLVADGKPVGESASESRI